MRGHRNTQGAEQSPPSVSRFGNCDDCGIVQEADHRIANHLALLAGFVRLKASDLARNRADPSEQDVQLVLDAINSQIVAVGRLHRSLTRDGASADLAEHLHEISASLSALCDDVEIVEDFQPGCIVRPDQILPLIQIVSEVLLNAVKHVHPPGARARIIVRCVQDRARRIQIEIADNGGGLPETFDPERDGGLGFCLLRALAGQLQARIEFQSSDVGLCFRLTLPPPARRSAPRKARSN